MKFRPIPKGMREHHTNNLGFRFCLKCNKKLKDCTCLYPQYARKGLNPRTIALMRLESKTASIHEGKKQQDKVYTGWIKYYCNIDGQMFRTIHNIRVHVAKFHNGNWREIRKAKL